jgi:hypothetical protein
MLADCDAPTVEFQADCWHDDQLLAYAVCLQGRRVCDALPAADGPGAELVPAAAGALGLAGYVACDGLDGEVRRAVEELAAAHGPVATPPATAPLEHALLLAVHARAAAERAAAQPVLAGQMRIAQVECRLAISLLSEAVGADAERLAVTAERAGYTRASWQRSHLGPVPWNTAAGIPRKTRAVA